MLRNQTFLGLDVGTKYIGTAIGQTITRTATPLLSINVINGKPNWTTLDPIIREWKPDAIIIGMPEKLSPKNKQISSFIKEMSRKLEARYNIEIFFVNEDFTSVEAKANLFKQKGYRALKKENVDCYSAKLILEDWLMQPE